MTPAVFPIEQLQAAFGRTGLRGGLLYRVLIADPIKPMWLEASVDHFAYAKLLAEEASKPADRVVWVVKSRVEGGCTLWSALGSAERGIFTHHAQPIP